MIRSILRRAFSVGFVSLSLGAGCATVAVSAAAQSSGIPAAPPNPSTPLPSTQAATHVVADSILTAPAIPLPTPQLAAEFAIPTTLLDLQSLHLLRACQSQFERAVQLNARGSLAPSLSSRGTPQSTTPASPFVPLSDSAITVGRQCLARIGDTKALPPVTLPLLFRYAVGINDDTLVQNVVARQLAIAGSDVRDRGRVLDTAVTVLLRNQWNDQVGGSDLVVHRTPAHDTLALGYAAQLDTMRPVGQVLVSRLRVRERVHEITKSSVWNVDDDLAWQQAELRVMMSVPLQAVAPADTAEIHQGYGGSQLGIARLTYFKTLTHAKLAAYLAMRDSLLGKPKELTEKSLVNHPAPRVESDYWFNLPAGMSSPPVIPAPKTVTLLMFADSLSNGETERLQRFHTKYPALQIVLVSMTKGGGGEPQSHDQVAQEAAQIATRFTEAVHWPVLVGVLETKYHTEADATDIPVASPVLDRFHLDPRTYAGKVFILDADGWLVEDRPGSFWNGQLLQRLMEH